MAVSGGRRCSSAAVAPVAVAAAVVAGPVSVRATFTPEPPQADRPTTSAATGAARMASRAGRRIGAMLVLVADRRVDQTSSTGSSAICSAAAASRRMRKARISGASRSASDTIR